MKKKEPKDQNYTLRQLLIRRIMVIGFFISICATVEDLIINQSIIRTAPLLGLDLLFCLSMIIAFKADNVEFGARLIGAVAIFLAFPYIFVTNGAIEGGASIWLVLGIFYAIGMFHGVEMIIYLILAIIADTTVYLLCLTYPELIVTLANKETAYFDSIFAVVLVGVLIGAVTKYQLNGYEKARRLAMKQRDEIEEMSNSRSAFFASMSHEIRTPINTIIGLNEMIMRDANISDEAAEDAANIQNASKMLLSLVNDILDMSQIENDKMEILETDYSIKELVGELVDMIKVRLAEKKLDFSVYLDPNLPTVLYGDDKRIKQVLLNLLANAAKYTKEGSVSFSINGEKIGEEFCRLEIAVKDTGIGIKTEYLDSLFDMFQRVDKESNREIEGTGLGLPISKQLMELMGGKIVVDSIYTKGSTFTVILEQKIVDSKPVGRVDFMANDKGRCGTYHHSFEAPEAHILVVDDNDMNRVVVEKLLRSTKIKIDQVANGNEALIKTKSSYYNLILMDYMMPEISGEETTALIRRQENGLNKNTPVVVLTADTTSKTGKNYQAMGFDAFLEKPFNGIQLEKVIMNFLPEDLLEYKLNEKEDTSIALNNYNSGERRHKKIILTTECNCDLTGELCNKYDIRLMYMYICTDKGRFCDIKEINTDNLSKVIRDGSEAIKIKSGTIQDYENFFAECLVEAQDVIHISLGKNIGPSYDFAVSAARGFGHVHVIDSGLVSSGLAIMMMKLGELVNQGATVDEVISRAEYLKTKIGCSILMPGAPNLGQNHNKRSFADLICNSLSIHSVIRVGQSSLKLGFPMIGNMRSSYKKLIYRYSNDRRKLDNSILYISHVSLPLELQNEILDEAKKRERFDDVILECCSVTNACYVGLGTISIAYIRE